MGGGDAMVEGKSGAISSESETKGAVVIVGSGIGTYSSNMTLGYIYDSNFTQRDHTLNRLWELLDWLFCEGVPSWLLMAGQTRYVIVAMHLLCVVPSLFPF